MPEKPAKGFFGRFTKPKPRPVESETGVHTHSPSSGPAQVVLPASYYELDGAPLMDDLATLPFNFKASHLDGLAEERSLALDVVSEDLAEKVVAKSHELAEGLANARLLEADLQNAMLKLKQSRSKLALSSATVTSALKVTRCTKRKQVLESVWQPLLQLRKATGLLSALKAARAEGDYADALWLSFQCIKALSDVDSRIKMGQTLKNSAQQLMDIIPEDMQHALCALCLDFDEMTYERLLQGYAFLLVDEDLEQIKTLLQMAYQNVVQFSAFRTVNSVLLIDTTLQKRAAEATTLHECAVLLPHHLFCTAYKQMVSTFWDILVQYSRMEAWHARHSTAKEELIDTGPIKRLAHQALLHSKHLIWDEMIQHMSILLTITHVSFHRNHFMEVWNWTAEMASIGDSFAGTSGRRVLHAILERQCGTDVFGSFHRNNVLEMDSLLNREVWQQLAPPPPPPPPAPHLCWGHNGREDCSFSRHVSRGNPWVTPCRAEDTSTSPVDDCTHATKTVHTKSSIYSLQLIHNYTQLMTFVPSVKGAILVSISEVVDVYLLHVYATFGGLSIKDTPRLNVRLQKTLKEMLGKYSSIISSKIERLKHLMSSAEMESSSAAASSTVSHQGNLYGLAERHIALKSLRAITQSTPALFISEGVLLDLEKSVYLGGLKHLLGLDWLADTIGGWGRYGEGEAPVEHAPWVNRLRDTVLLMKRKLEAAESTLPDGVVQVTWGYASMHISETLLQGFASVKNCSMAGRSAMSLDLQAVVKALQDIIPISVDVHIVDEYIKGFYLPLSEIISWAESRPCYNKDHILSLCSNMASSRGLNVKDQQALIAQIEAALRVNLTF